MIQRYLGIDVGAETAKVIELDRLDDGRLCVGGRWFVEHGKEPARRVRHLLGGLDWKTVRSAAATGRASRRLRLSRVPTKAALARGVRYAHPEIPQVTVVSIGSHGFSVLELRGEDHQVYRENSRCSQGTGNFLRQLVERFGLSVEQASQLSAAVEKPAALSGRCPVILKTDMTHLANKGEDRAAIVAGLYDAVCENVQALIKPTISPPRVVLAGGVMRAACVRQNFRRFLEQRGMQLVEVDSEETLYLEALGAAFVAIDEDQPVPGLKDLIVDDSEASFERIPALRESMNLVTRMPRPEAVPGEVGRAVVLGFDIGSTGSKALALDPRTRRPLWQGYVSTRGNPVAAARTLTSRFLEETNQRHPVAGIGATGSGREIVGSLMASCFGCEPIFVLNEIAAHAEGALYFDSEVDTIIEIGGQDAKYIRLDGGRICDAAMNEACSAGTGSFIEEQGAKFEGVSSVTKMGEMALEADSSVSLGQHCSVFMAEVIDEAVSSGVSREPLLAGIYDSIIQNYLNRVKGNRSLGKRVFCQGMPFMSDALAAAVARQTGRRVVIPPIPGAIGALGIALLAAKEVAREAKDAKAGLDLGMLLTAAVEGKDVFVCRSTKGCGGGGNKCKIDRLTTRMAGKKQQFLWGGNCSLYDTGTRKRKLPDLAPDPFRDRKGLVRAVIARQSERRAGGNGTGRPTVAVTDEFVLKGMLPFFVEFVGRLGFNVKVFTEAGQKALKRGIENATVPFCAPMQLYQGVVAQILADEPDFLLAPRLRELPRQVGETHAVTCPIVQASSDIVAWQPGRLSTRLLTSRIDMGPGNLSSRRFRETTKSLARELGADSGWQGAFDAACDAQRRFERDCKAIGRRALEFAKANNVIPVVVLGRSYTVYNTVLSSNVPDILREQGALAIPVDCYPVSPRTPVFDDLYWGYSQVNLRAAHHIRRTDGVYAVFCSNYSCGPDSFNLHFFAYTMEGKPFAVIETDGHSGDAGTKTRLEAFLYCVESDRGLPDKQREALPTADFERLEAGKITVGDARRSGELLLVPRMGPCASVLAQLLQADGGQAEVVPVATRDSLRLGRRYTSGKECLPLTITAGALLDRLERDRHTDERFAFFMPGANGPCRFGVYNLLHKVILEKAGWSDRVRIVSPADKDYFTDVAPDLHVRVCAGFVAADVLQAGYNDVRTVERKPGLARDIYERYREEMLRLLRVTGPRPLARSLAELGNGVFGLRDLLRRAAGELRAAKDFAKDVPTVAVVGEIYVRLDPFANDFVVEKLANRGIRAVVAPFSEWMEYVKYLQMQRIREDRALPGDSRLGGRIAYAIQSGVLSSLFGEMGRALGWGSRTRIEDALEAAAPYIGRELTGEAVLTLGGPVYEHAHGLIDGVVAVGPHECMPNKVAEAQFAHVGEETGLLTLTLALNGDPVDAEILDRFTFEVAERHRSRPAELRQRTDSRALPRLLATYALRAAVRCKPPRRGSVGELLQIGPRTVEKLGRGAGQPRNSAARGSR